MPRLSHGVRQPSSKARVAATTRWPASSVDNESFIAVTSRPRDALRSLQWLSAVNSHGFMCCSSLRLCVGLVDYCHQDNAHSRLGVTRITVRASLYSNLFARCSNVEPVARGLSLRVAGRGATNVPCLDDSLPPTHRGAVLMVSACVRERGVCAVPTNQAHRGWRWVASS